MEWWSALVFRGVFSRTPMACERSEMNRIEKRERSAAMGKVETRLSDHLSCDHLQAIYVPSLP